MRKKIITLFFSTLFISSVLYAQDEIPKYGKDSLECMKMISLYSTFYKQKNYIDALLGWRYVYSECPRSTKNIYLHGAKMYQSFIKKEKDATIKEALIDTLMIIYDKRIKYFGEEGKVIGRKGVDIFKFRKETELEVAYGYLSKSLELRGDKTEGAVLLNLMQAALIQLKTGKETCDKIVNLYSKSGDAIDIQIKKYTEKGKKIDNLLKAKTNIDNLFVNSECAKCDAVIPIFTKKFQENPTDVELLKKIVKILGKQDCTKDPLYTDAAEKLYSIDSTAIDPYAMGQLFKKKGDYTKAARFFKQAIEVKTDPNDLADCYYNLADIYGNNLGQKAQGRTYAYSAIKQRSNWGKPYLLIGIFYASSSKNCGDEPFTQKAVVWAAIDKFAKAKAVDSSVASDANKLIAKYAAYFPLKSEGFFRGINEGASYTVACWINETTKARFKADE